MKWYEYKRISYLSLDGLEDLGSEGWKPVGNLKEELSYANRPSKVSGYYYTGLMIKEHNE